MDSNPRRFAVACSTPFLPFLPTEFEELLLMANAVRGKPRRALLEQADGRLQCLQSLLRYTADWKLLGGNQIKYMAECLTELGRLLGAWLKGTDRN